MANDVEISAVLVTEYGHVPLDGLSAERLERVPWTKKRAPDLRFKLGKIASEVLPPWESRIADLAKEKWLAEQPLVTVDIPPMADFGWPKNL